MPTLLAALLAAATAAAPSPKLKVAIVPLTAGEGVTDKVAASITEVATSEVRRIPGVQLLTQQEVGTLIGFDRQRAMLGCQEDSCVAEVGGALGVEHLVFGTISKLGESWLVTFKLMDVKNAKMLAQADRRIRNGTVDDVLDAMAPMVKELFGSPELAPPAPQPAKAAGSPAFPRESQPVPPGSAEEPYDFGGKRPDLQVATDGKGRYFAFVPYSSDSQGLFVGDGKRFFEQRIIGASAQDGSFDYTFWEPRAPARWQAVFAVKDGKPQLQCGKTPTPLKLLSAGEARKLLGKAQFFKPRWRRKAHALARDDEGNYYFVDRLREPENSKDFRLFVGTKGKMRAVKVEDAIIDEAGEIFFTSLGRLKMKRGPQTEAEFAVGALRTPLVWLEVERNAAFAYGELGAYAGEQLGNACDGLF
ncbi:MAG: hypothetical protein ACOX6T_25175 [Myxococcales bacterium]|jgi:TolB-like protein